MDMYAMATAMNAMATANTAAKTQPARQDASSSSDVSFAQLLYGVTGMDGNDGTSMQQLSGLSWRDVQAGMMTDAMKALQDAEQPMVTDPVLAQLLEMLKNLSSANGEQLDFGQLTSLVEQMQKRLQQILEENAAIVAGQQALALLGTVLPQLAGVPMDNDVVQALGADGGQNLLEMFTQTDPQDLASMLMGMPAEKTENVWQPQQTTQPQPQPAAQPAQAAASTAGAAALPHGEDVVETTVQTVASPVAEGGFEQAVRTAKQMMSEADSAQPQVAKAPQQEELDVDILQQRVDTGFYLQNTTLAQPIPEGQPLNAEALIPAPEIQLAEGIQEAVVAGEQQFTITLRPQELGEVIVQLTRVGEGMMLNIVTQNAETQGVLAAQLDALKENLRPLNVEVGAIVSQQQFAMMAGGQTFGGQRQQDFTPLHGAAYYGDEPLGATEVQSVTQAQMVMAQSALDTYI